MSTAEAGLGIAGIVISLITFWLGYKQTIGAKQERVRGTDEEIETTLLKRILLEHFTPTREELARYIRGKAIAARINASDLRPVRDLVPLLWVRLLENDLVPAERRDAVLRAVYPPDKADGDSVSPTDPSLRRHIRRRRRRMQLEPILFLAVAAALVGTAVSAAPTLKTSGADVFDLAAVFVAALVLIGGFATILFFRSGVEEVAFSGGGPSGPEILTRNYPDREQGLEALDVLRGLSPLAVATLGRFGHDELSSARTGIARGLFVRTGSTPWHQELVEAGLLRFADPPKYIEVNGRQFLVLTDEGKKVARLVIANEPVPEWFTEALRLNGNDDRAEEVAEAKIDTVDGVATDPLSPTS